MSGGFAGWAWCVKSPGTLGNVQADEHYALPDDAPDKLNYC